MFDIQLNFIVLEQRNSSSPEEEGTSSTSNIKGFMVFKDGFRMMMSS